MQHAAKLLAVAALALGLGACGGNEDTSTAAPAPAPDAAPAAPAQAGQAPAEAPTEVTAFDLSGLSVAQAVTVVSTGPHRSQGNAARNVYRHPVETLEFFDMQRDDVVVEVWPGGGSAWYTEVLAPVLRDEGKLIAAGWSLERGQDWQVRAQTAFNEKMAAHPEVYDAVEVVGFQGDGDGFGEPGSADLVLLSRHFHNFIANDVTEAVLQASFDVLAPGGVLGVIQHRADEDDPPESEERDGYVKESTVIAAAEAAGFEFVERSEVNANPADTKDHPEGVWTLPPSLELCKTLSGAEAFECTATYRAIGESDRMTLKFIKPAA